MRIGLPQALINAHKLHQPVRLLLELGAGRKPPRHLQRLNHRVLDAKARIQARIRVLEHDLHLLPDFAKLRAVDMRDVLSLQVDFPVCCVQQMDDRAAQRALAAAGLAHGAERLSPGNAEADVIDRVVDSGGNLEVFFEVLHSNQLLCHVSSLPSPAPAARGKSRRTDGPAQSRSSPAFPGGISPRHKGSAAQTHTPAEDSSGPAASPQWA